jgi:hypothetical protein
MLWRKPPWDIAKVGVEGSNPFARFKLDMSKAAVFRGFLHVGSTEKWTVKRDLGGARLPRGYKDDLIVPR